MDLHQLDIHALKEAYARGDACPSDAIESVDAARQKIDSHIGGYISMDVEAALEEAKKRGYKAVVKRAVVRLVTPGTLTEDALLEARRHNFLASYMDIRGQAALAWADISTGAFHVMPIKPARLGPELARLAPSELIVSETSESELLQ